MIIEKKHQLYLPQDLNIDWNHLEPIFNELLTREISSVNELEQWLKDKSELEAALEEDFAWRYIKMTCATDNEDLLKSFQYFATEIEPKMAPLNNDLNKKLVDSAFVNELNHDEYYVYLRSVKKSLALFREENIPLQTEIQIKQQKYQGITGAMSVTFNGQEYTLEQAANFLKDLNRETRQQAWENITARRLQDKDQLDALFNELKALRHKVAQNAGFDNYRDYMFEALGRFDYTPQDCFNFHEAIANEVVPLLAEQANERVLALDLESLKPWDTDVDTSGKAALKPFNNGEELIDKSIKCFNKLSPFLGSRLEVMKANNL